MRSIAVVVAVIVLTTTGYAQPQLDLELHAVTQDAAFANVYDPGPITIDPEGMTEFSLELFARARLTGDPEATGLSIFDGLLSQDGSGVWSPAPLTVFDTFGIGLDMLDPNGRTGLTPDYASSCIGPCDPVGPMDPMGDWSFLPIIASPTGATDAVENLDDVYKVRWTTTDLSPRTVHLTLSATGAGYQALNGAELRTLAADQGQIDADTLTIIIEGPTCGCEYDGASGVNVFDLLAYLDLWFLGDGGADIDGSPGVDVFDLLHFLDCWFPASMGAPCP